MKRKIAFLVAAAVAFGCCGCSGNGKSASSDVVTLTWLVPGDKQTDIASVINEVNKITEPAIGAKVDLQFIDESAYSEKMTMNMAAGASYDLCFTGYVNKYQQAVDKGGLMDITDLIDKQAQNLKKSIPEYAWETAKVKNKIYAVPNLQVMALPYSMVVLDDVAKKYNFDFSTVKKPEDLEPYLKMVKDGESGMYPYRPNYSWAMWTYDKYEQITSGIAIRADGSSSECVYLFETPEFLEAYKTLQEWNAKGYFRPDIVSVGNDSQDYNAGKYAVSNTGYKPGVESNIKALLNKPVSVYPVQKAYLNREKATAAMTGIGAKCKNPQKAIKLIELINTNKDLYNLISFGIKDKHYKLDADNKVSFIENSGYKPDADWKFGNQFNALIREGQNDDIWEETAKLNETAVKSPILGFSLDTSKIKTEISQVAAVMSEFTYLDPSPDYLEKLYAKLDAAGRSRIKDEVQRQVDEYLKTKSK